MENNKTRKPDLREEIKDTTGILSCNRCSKSTWQVLGTPKVDGRLNFAKPIFLQCLGCGWIPNSLCLRCSVPPEKKAIKK